MAEDYVKFFYTDEAQKIIAENYYRPINPEVLAQFQDRFAPVELFTVKDVAKDWEDADRRFFADNGVFDDIYFRIGQVARAHGNDSHRPTFETDRHEPGTARVVVRQ